MTIEQLTTGVGRIVWGNPAKSTIKKDMDTRLSVMRDGQEVEQWAFGVAFPKAEFEQIIWPAMAQEAGSAYPSGFPPRFSWKYKDGDSIDPNGKPYSDREGYAGCHVLTVTTEAFAPPIFKWEAAQNDYRKVEAHEIKTGDYVRLNMNMKVNVPTNPTYTPGLYINPNGIELIGFGQEIVSAGGADAGDMFGGAPVALPEGASAVPLSSAPANAALPGMAQPPAAAPPAAAPVQSLPPADPNFVANATGTAPAQAMQPAHPPQGVPAAAPLQPQAATTQSVPGTAPAATTSPSSEMPGMPLPR